jgi:cell division ATPase FtsA
MERIVIEVTDDIAKKWRLSSPETKEKITQRMRIRLMKELLKENKEELFKAMDRIARTAKENGLTEEILQEILAEDD